MLVLPPCFRNLHQITDIGETRRNKGACSRCIIRFYFGTRTLVTRKYNVITVLQVMTTRMTHWRRSKYVVDISRMHVNTMLTELPRVEGGNIASRDQVITVHYSFLLGTRTLVTRTCNVNSTVTVMTSGKPHPHTFDIHRRIIQNKLTNRRQCFVTVGWVRAQNIFV